MLSANHERKPTRIEGKGKGKGKGKGSRIRSGSEPEQRKGQGKGSETSCKSRSGRGAEREAHKPTKRGYPPPIGKGQAALPLITNSRQKIRKKSLGVVLKKFSEKFFGGMFRGKEKPLALSQRKGGCLINLTNHGKCRISNLAMQITKNAQKHYLITECKGR